MLKDPTPDILVRVSLRNLFQLRSILRKDPKNTKKVLPTNVLAITSVTSKNLFERVKLVGDYSSIVFEKTAFYGSNYTSGRLVLVEM